MFFEDKFDIYNLLREYYSSMKTIITYLVQILFFLPRKDRVLNSLLNIYLFID